MQQTIDQQTADFERAREALLAESRRLTDDLTSERRNCNELAAHIQQLVDSGTADNGRRIRTDKEAIEALKQRVYPTLFAKHDGYHNIAHMLSDLLRNGGDRFRRERRKRQPLYKAIPNETNAHLRVEHEKSAENQAEQIKKLRRYLQKEKDRAHALEATLHQTSAAKDREFEHLHAQYRCSICMERRCDTTFICVREDGMHFVCGRLACAECADQWKNVKKDCHVCRARIYQCTKLYFSGES